MFSLSVTSTGYKIHHPVAGEKRQSYFFYTNLFLFLYKFIFNCINVEKTSCKSIVADDFCKRVNFIISGIRKRL